MDDGILPSEQSLHVGDFVYLYCDRNKSKEQSHYIVISMESEVLHQKFFWQTNPAEYASHLGVNHNPFCDVEEPPSTLSRKKNQPRYIVREAVYQITSGLSLPIPCSLFLTKTK